MPLDFSRADHLPNLRRGQETADPGKLPRQRRGTTPQMHGRYPDYDILEQGRHWDEATRGVVLGRVDSVPPLRFFSAREAATLRELCDLLTAQDAEPRIPVLNYVDEKYFEGRLDGYQFEDMPDDRETWRSVARGLDEEGLSRAGSASFADAPAEVRHAIVTDLAKGELSGGVWSELNVSRAFSVVMRGVLEAFYSHPWAWNEIGFGGPAYPRGYSRFGSPHLQAAERESWEGREAFDEDPVSGERQRPPT
ncbi:MAG TPA: gluconate 2-dehydrogenase subunit 3 family protein [Solirubrobacteraceae bacterium]